MRGFPHENAREFVEAVRFTAGETGFSEALVEKDYYCSIVLREIFSGDAGGLVFKGGTLLNKAHAGFYRLSEDLDFSVDAEPGLKKKQRSVLSKRPRARVNEIAKALGFKFSKEIAGANESMQYNGELEYRSLLTGSAGTIKIEIGIREKVLERTELSASTLAMDPFSREPLVPVFVLHGLSLNEAYAEKTRAALSRESPAIRDIFDIDYAVRKGILKTEGIAELARKKFEVQGRKVKLSKERKEMFRAQLETDLRPVLRAADYSAFEFEAAWGRLEALADSLFPNS